MSEYRREIPVTERDRETCFREVQAANPGDDAAVRARVRRSTRFAEGFPAFGPSIAGARKDELDVEEVVVFRLRRR